MARRRRTIAKLHVLASQSTDVSGCLQRGARLHASGFITEAYHVFIEALERAPDDPRVQTRVGDFLLARGELAEADRLFSMAAARGDIGGLCGLVEVCERRGQLDEAWALIERIPGALDHSLALRVVAARILARRGRVGEACELLVAVNPALLSDDDASGVLYALGDLQHQLGKPDRAFSAWRRANARRSLTCDRQALDDEVDTAIERYDEAAFLQLPRGSISDRPVFIVGMPRSGTSLVEQILASHPDVFGAGELPDINALFHATDHASTEQVERAAKTYLGRLTTLDGDAARVTDKMPFNAMRLGFIAQLFPHARVIHCTRDAQDAALSIFGRNFSDWHSYAGDLGDIAHYIANHERVMEHWRSVLPLSILEVQYEQLVHRGEAAMRELFDHVGLSWHAEALNFHQQARTVKTASYAQVQKPLYTSSVGRARAYSKQLRTFRKELSRLRDQTAKAA